MYVCVRAYVHTCAYILYVHIYMCAIYMHICVHKCVYMEREKFYFKEFAHVTAGAEKCNICRTGWQAGNLKELMFLS